MSKPASYAVVVLTGGTSRRMGGDDKTALDLGAGRSVLDHLVGSIERNVSVVVVGPPRDLERPVTWTSEVPAGGGPVAGLAAGVRALAQSGIDPEWVVTLAGDQPFAGQGLAPLLSSVDGEVHPDAVIGQDGEGRDQPLLSAYRLAVLGPLLAGDVAGASLRSVLARLDTGGAVVRRVPLPPLACLDIDEPADLERARAHLDPP